MKEGNYKTRQLIQIAVSRWYVFVTGFLLFLVGAYLYLKNVQPVYEATARLLIKNSESQLIEEQVFSEFGPGKKNKNLENEVLVLSSTPLMYRVVESLELQYQFTGVQGFSKDNLYLDTPVKVLYWQPEVKDGGLGATLRKNNAGGYYLLVDEEEYAGEFGKELQLPSGKLVLIRSGDIEAYDEILIRISSIWNRSRELLDNFTVEVYGENSSVLNLSLKDINPHRAQAVLSNLIEYYNQYTIDDKNRIYENAIQFIDERILLIAEELSETESDVEEYKRRFNVVELSSEGNMILNELSNFNRQMSEANAQMEILNTIQAFLIKNQKNFEFVPTNLSLNNLTLTRLLEKFNELLAEQDLLRTEVGMSHPDMKLIESQLTNLRQTIINNIYAIKKDLQIKLNASKELQGNLENRLQSLPRRERELVNIERKKDIKERLYVYLLQKREESAISLAVTAATGQIVEPPSFSTPVYPKKAQIWLIAIFFGLAVPALVVILLENMNDKVRFREDIAQHTRVPLAGVIARSKGKDEMVLKENVFNPYAELFRLLRLNLTRALNTGNFKTLLITSSVRKEGKTYIAMNLGMAQALTGRRVIVVDVNFRSHKPSRDAKGFGLIDYLTNSRMTPDHIIQNDPRHPLLDTIGSGSQAADPNKLVLSTRLRDLVAQLKERYDFVILDAPPLHMMTDTFEMSDMAEAILYVVRSGVTKKSHLNMVDALWKSNPSSNTFIVLNEVSLNTIRFNGFTYGIGRNERPAIPYSKHNGVSTLPEVSI